MRGINKLGANDLWIPEGIGNFQALTANTLGNEITDHDGWESDLNQVASALGEDIGTVNSLDDLLGLTSFIPGELDSAALVPLADDHATLLDAGSQLIKDTIDSISSDPTNNPPPDTGGGDGGGQGGGQGGGDHGGQGGQDGQGFGPQSTVPTVSCVLIDHANRPSEMICSVQGGIIGREIHPPLQD